MTIPMLSENPEQFTGKAACLGRNDPLLQELWLAKATFNAAADYSVEKLAEMANRFDLEATLSRLRQQVTH